jgi:hypothetical protein
MTIVEPVLHEQAFVFISTHHSFGSLGMEAMTPQSRDMQLSRYPNPSDRGSLLSFATRLWPVQ